MRDWVFLATMAALPLAAACGSRAAPSGGLPPARASVAPSVAVAATPKLFGATEIVNGLKAAGLPIGKMESYTASDDPNRLLGRPGQYTSKVNFADTRLPAPGVFIEVEDGGSVESFDSAAAATRRASYLATVSQSSPLLLEYDYRSGTVVLRLGKQLVPDQAERYAAALGTIMGSAVIAATPEGS